jgi:hypothetical protein
MNGTGCPGTVTVLEHGAMQQTPPLAGDMRSMLRAGPGTQPAGGGSLQLAR